VYEGEFSDNLKSGYGIKRFDSGSVYEGDWLDDKMHGEGEFRWPQGDIYRGGYRKGLRDGFGLKVWASGTKYSVWMINSRATGRETREKAEVSWSTRTARSTSVSSGTARRKAWDRRPIRMELCSQPLGMKEPLSRNKSKCFLL